MSLAHLLGVSIRQMDGAEVGSKELSAVCELIPL
jgi:hypothetical protein